MSRGLCAWCLACRHDGMDLQGGMEVRGKTDWPSIVGKWLNATFPGNVTLNNGAVPGTGTQYAV